MLRLPQITPTIIKKENITLNLDIIKSENLEIKNNIIICACIISIIINIHDVNDEPSKF